MIQIHIIPLLFWMLEIVFFIRYKAMYYYMQLIPRILRRKKDQGPVHIIIIDQGILLFILFYIGRLFFFLYCLYLILFEDTLWEPACMLLMLSSLEQLAVYYQVTGLAQKDPDSGLLFPTLWFTALMRGMSIYVLSHLAFTIV